MGIVLLVLLLLVGLGGLGWLVWQMLQQQGRVLLRLEALETSRARVDLAMPGTVPMATAIQRNVNGAVGSAAPVSTKIGDGTVNLSQLDSETSAEGTADPLDMANGLAEPTEVDENIELTIGMATFNDFEGVYFTLQALQLYQDLEHTELLVIDNYGCPDTKNLVEGWLKGRYILAKSVVGTAAPRDLVFRKARGKAVLCCDSHVLFAPGVIGRLKQFYQEHPDCQDLLQGPMLYDDGKTVATHFDPVWRDQMWGTWGSDARGEDADGEPFEIPMQGLGVFSCLKEAWLGFNPEFRGFGGEEGYIHEKFRQAGRRCLCLPWLRWVHRFSRPAYMKYTVTVEEKLRNYLIGHTELGLDLEPILRHFSEHIPHERVIAIAEQTLGMQWTNKPVPRQTLVVGDSPQAQKADTNRGQVAGAIDLPMAAAASQENDNGATVTPLVPAVPSIGDIAPDFSLPDLSGKLVRLSNFRGHQTLVLFWRPDCGFCQRMLPDLLAWESQPPQGAPRLLVVSTGGVQDNQVMGLRSTVVLDQTGMSIGREFGAVGTPMAVLIDAGGRIASELEAGAPAILVLANGGREKAVYVR